MSDRTCIRQFDMNLLTPNRTIVTIGKRGSGKSVLIRDILYHYRYIPEVVLFSATEESNSGFSDIIPSVFIYNDFSEKVLQKIIDRQRELATRLSKEEMKRHAILIVLDDMAYSNFLRGKAIKQLFFNGRHSHITCIISLQYSLDIPASLRGNIDILFTFKDVMKKSRDRLYQYYFGMFSSLKTFEKALDACTHNYSSMVLNNCSPSTEISETVFFYKATIRQDHTFRCGSERIWKMDKLWRKRNKENDTSIIIR
mgnify:CR=1 FL=1